MEGHVILKRSLEDDSHDQATTSTQSKKFKDVFYCYTHPEEVIKIYCEHCKKPLCPVCAILEHKEHDLKNVEKATTEADDVMRKLLDSWETAANHSVAMSDECMKVFNNLDRHEGQLVYDIVRKFSDFKDKLIQEIDIMKTQSIGHLKQQVDSARQQAKLACNEAKATENSIKGTLNHARNFLESARGLEKLQQFPEMKVQLERLDLTALKTQVTQPIFKLQHEGFTIPRLAVKVTGKLENQRIPLSYFQPLMRDTIVQTRCFNSLLPGEVVVGGVVGCYGLSVNDKWFITTSNKKVKVFDRVSGAFMFEVNQSQHTLNYPKGVTCNEKGEIFITDDGRLVKYNEQGQLMKVSAPGMYRDDRGGVVCHGDQLIVTDKNGRRVVIADFDCNIKKTISKESLGMSAFGPALVCIDNDGHLVVSDQSSTPYRVFVVDYQHSVFIRILTELLGPVPFGVCVDKWGHILVALRNSNQVLLLSGRSGHARVLLTSDDVNRPTDLVVTGPGEFAVLEEETGNVKVFKYADLQYDPAYHSLPTFRNVSK